MEPIAEESSTPYISPSAVSFSPHIEQIDVKPSADGNPDWTIQKETSITIDKTINESKKFCNKKLQIITGITILIALIFLITFPIVVLSTGLFSSSYTTIKTTMITTQTRFNSSKTKFDKEKENFCRNSSNMKNTYWISFDLFFQDSTSLFDCCFSCLNIPLCHAFIYDNYLSICYFKSEKDNHQIIDQRYQSGQVL